TTGPKVINFQGSLEIKDYHLSQNYPNPFNPATTIKYEIPKEGIVSLKVYDILGREVTTLVNKHQNIGRYEVKFDASSLSTGVYIYRLTVSDPSAASVQAFTESCKMILMK
ncbi:MAG: T9SS type A sorting domain-containing protein, partial [Melioribacteraceae bacterium]|nr:T9SS type A sorting domain-containing protein [Melioribacteraceae bacterium]